MEGNGAGREEQTVQAASPPNGNNVQKHKKTEEDGRLNPWRAAMSKCSVCASKFTIFNQRHMCGWCKQPACDRCSRGRKLLRAYHKPSRVCDYCMGRFRASKDEARGDASTPSPLKRDARGTVPASLDIEDSNCSSVAAPSTADLSPLTTSSGGTFFPESDAGTHPPMQQPAVSKKATRENAGEGGARVRFEGFEGEAGVEVEGEATVGVEDEAKAGEEGDATVAVECEAGVAVEVERGGGVDLEGQEGGAVEGEAGFSAGVDAGVRAGVEREDGVGVDAEREVGFSLEREQSVVVKVETDADVEDEAGAVVPGKGEEEVNDISRIVRPWENWLDSMGYSHLYVGLSVGVIGTSAGYCLGYLSRRRP